MREPSKRLCSAVFRANSGPSCVAHDRRPSGLPQGPPSFGGLLDASFPAVRKARRSAVMANLTLIYAMLRYLVGAWREIAMGQDRSEVTEQVVKFPPKQQSGNPADEAGQAVITQIRKAAELANENCDRAMALAHKLAMQLRAAEDRITQLEAEVAVFRDRATRAEGWLQTIHSEIEQKLIAPRSAFGTEQTLVSSNSNTEPSQPPAA